MKSKKFLALLLIVTLLLGIALLAACQKDEEGYVLVVPDGAPALSIACLSDEVTTSDTVYKLNKKIVAASAIQTEASNSDLAIVPANLASILFNGGNDVKILAVVTNGNLFVCSSQEKSVDGIEGLVGKLVYSIGQNSVPDMIFKTLLNNKNVAFKTGEQAQDGVVTIKYFANGSEVNARLLAANKSGEQVYGVLAEPDVQTGISEGLYEIFNLQELWSEYNSDGYAGYAQAVLIAKSNVCEDEKFVKKLLEEFAKNKTVLLENAELAENNIKALYPQTSLQNNLSSQVIARCNIDTISMENGREYYENTLKAVMAINANLIGGKMPSDEFYYISK
ncbi:MAG: hypothetical protein K2J89_02685 [Clostridia bacterium]|nr:hypothetical protein [Clostridia bacterium]